MKVSGDWLHQPAAQRILARLAAAGCQGLFVGGCVRNAVAGLPVADIDLATDAEPAAVIALAEAAGMRAVPTGIAHGTVTLVLEGETCQITTFRADVETFGRKARVAFSRDIATDAARRDFTINALYALADGTLVDPLNGLPDLQAGVVRFVGDADSRIREDCLRILRLFRFQAWFGAPGQPMDAAALAAAEANLGGIARLSHERIGAEIRKLLAAPDPAAAVRAMAKAGVLPLVLPGADGVKLEQLIAAEKAVAATPAWPRRLALLDGEGAEWQLRLSRPEARALAAIEAAAAYAGSPRQVAQLFGASAAFDGALVQAARNGTPVPADLQAQANSGAAELFPVRAADLAGLVAPGPGMGRALAELRQHWLESGMTLSQAQLLARLRQRR